MVNLPAVNTPQFRWIRNHMPRKPQPFGAIFEPEVAARAIVEASEHPRREINVSGGTTQAIIANAFAPGLLDHYLSRIGYDGQQSDEPEEPGRPDNLPDEHLDTLRDLWHNDSGAYLRAVEPGVEKMLLAACAF
jgi:hypothetical protein